MADADLPRSFIKSLARGMSVLEAFSPARPRLTLTQLAAAAGLNLAAVQRSTITLLELGYLGKNKRKEYYLGPRVLSLARTFLEGSDLLKTAQDRLGDFSREIGCTVNLSVLDGDQVLIIFRQEVARFFSFDVRVGSRLPSYCTSMGKVLLAALDDDRLRRRLAAMNLERFTRRTITDPKKLLAEVRAVRRRGIGYSDREATLALCSMAAPVLDHRGRVLAAMNVSVLAEEAEQGRLEELSGKLADQGRILSAQMGYQGPYPVIAPQPGDGPITRECR